MSVLLLTAGLCCSVSGQQAAEKISLDRLIQLTLENDLELVALRGDHEVSLARAREIPYWEDPELRVRYTRIGDSQVPDPYTETITRLERESGRETISQSVAGSRRSTQTVDDGSGALEVRDNTRTTRGTETETRSLSGQTRETTVRTVTPGRDRVTTVETTTVNGSGTERRSATSRLSERENETRTTTLGPFTTTETRSGSGTTTDRSSSTVRRSEQLSRTETTERVYAQDPYEGGHEIGLQLRLEPRNPWEARQLTRLAFAEASLAEFEVRALERERANAVRAEYRELQYLQREASLASDRVKLLREDLADLDAVQAAGARLSGKPGEARAKLLEAEVKADTLRRTFQSRRNQLAEGAGLPDGSVIDLRQPLPPPALDPAGVDTNLLTRIALENNPGLARLTVQTAIHRAELSAKEAQRIPFLAFIAAEYAYRERYGDKEREDVGVYAGFSLPIFSWLDRDLGAGEKAALNTLQRQRDILSRRVTSRMNKVLLDLSANNRSLSSFRKKAPAVRKRIEEELARLPAENADLEIRRIRFELRAALLDIRAAQAEQERSQAETLLALETELGTGLDRVFTAAPDLPAPATPASAPLPATPAIPAATPAVPASPAAPAVPAPAPDAIDLNAPVKL